MWRFRGPPEPQTPPSNTFIAVLMRFCALRRFKHVLPDLSVIVSQPMQEPWTEVCFFDEQANDSLQLSILESRLRLLCERPNQRTVGSQTQNVLQYVSSYNTEEKLHWTQARIPTCCLTVGTYCNSNATPATSHECDHQRQWNVFVSFVCQISAFWFYVDQECYCKTQYIFKKKKKKSKNCIFSVDC